LAGRILGLSWRLRRSGGLAASREDIAQLHFGVAFGRGPVQVDDIDLMVFFGERCFFLLRDALGNKVRGRVTVATSLHELLLRLV